MVKILLVCGYVASGKTTTAEELAKSLDLEVIRTDDLRKEIFPREFCHGSIDSSSLEFVEMVESWIESNNPEEIDFQQVLNPLVEIEACSELVREYAPRIKDQKAVVYNQAFAELGRLLASGKSVLFDATFSKSEMRKRAYKAAIDNGVETVYIIQVVCSEDVVASRLTARQAGSQATSSNARQLEVFRAVKREFDSSRIQDDDPGLEFSRTVYDTGSHEVEQFGEEDETTKVIKDVLISLSKKYVAVNQ